jgi:hypothetical protein
MNYKTICVVMLSLLTPAVIGQGAHDSIPNGIPFLNPPALRAPTALPERLTLPARSSKHGE